MHAHTSTGVQVSGGVSVCVHVHVQMGGHIGRLTFHLGALEGGSESSLPVWAGGAPKTKDRPVLLGGRQEPHSLTLATARPAGSCPCVQLCRVDELTTGRC